MFACLVLIPQPPDVINALCEFLRKFLGLKIRARDNIIFKVMREGFFEFFYLFSPGKRENESSFAFSWQKREGFFVTGQCGRGSEATSTSEMLLSRVFLTAFQPSHLPTCILIFFYNKKRNLYFNYKSIQIHYYIC